MNMDRHASLQGADLIEDHGIPTLNQGDAFSRIIDLKETQSNHTTDEGGVQKGYHQTVSLLPRLGYLVHYTQTRGRIRILNRKDEAWNRTKSNTLTFKGTDTTWSKPGYALSRSE